MGTCIAIYSFEAQESDELTIQEGDLINVLGKCVAYFVNGHVDFVNELIDRSR